MRILWDEFKRVSNQYKHGLNFAEIEAGFDWEGAKITPVHSGRFKAVGRLNDGTVVVIFAMLGSEAISIISLRRASLRERNAA